MKENISGREDEEMPSFHKEVEIIRDEAKHLLDKDRFGVDFEHGENKVLITLYGTNRTPQTKAIALLPNITAFLNNHPDLATVFFSIHTESGSGDQYIVMQKKG